MLDYPQRKQIRAKWCNYGTGAYFVTICTKDKRSYFGYIKDSVMKYNRLGIAANKILNDISSHCRYADIPVHIVMPNHIHAIVVINESTNKPLGGRSLLSIAIGSIKSAITKYAHQSNIIFAWQNRYYDRIIRRYMNTKEICDYIRNNPAQWNTDVYYSSDNGGI